MAEPDWSADEIARACACLGIRRAARLLARRYDEALRPLGLTSGQFSILAALLRDQPVPLGALAEGLGLERTTLHRNLVPLEALGFLRTVDDPADRRVRALQLTGAGRRILRDAIPLWEAAQAETTRRLFGQAGWSALKSLLDRLSS